MTKTSLFDAKSLYLAIVRSPQGRDLATMSLPEAKRREYVYNNRHLVSQLEFDGPLPVVMPYNGPVNFQTVSFSERKSEIGRGQMVHFFLDDRRFRNLMWGKLEKTVDQLAKFEAVFAPDYSLWVDLPDFYNFESIFKNRVATAYMQKCGFSVIPVASFGNADSFHYCFHGLLQNSVIAVCGIGHLRCRACDALWHFAIRELERQVHPSLILVYGQEVDIPGVSTPVQFIPDFIRKRFRNNEYKK